MTMPEVKGMKIAIVGYGKMGRMIERVAASRGHEVIARFDIDNNPNGEGLKPAPSDWAANPGGRRHDRMVRAPGRG